MVPNNKDLQWIFACFGTAVGAGILFLPIRAGLGGAWSLIGLSLLICPITYLAHRGITRVVTSSDHPTDIIGAIERDYGSTVAFWVSILYFLSIVTICVGYATGLTNIVGSFLEHQLGIQSISRTWLTFSLLFPLTLVIFAGEDVMVRVTAWITYPLIFLLLILSFYMIPRWNVSLFFPPLELHSFSKDTFLLFPVVVFAMNFSPICSSMGISYRNLLPSQEATQRTDRIVWWTSLLLFIFVMFFVFSMVFASTPELLLQCQRENIDILTGLSLQMKEPFLRYFFPIIAFLAIVSSYFGHFVGTREGLLGILVRLLKTPPSKVKGLSFLVSWFMLLALWGLSVFNPSVLKMVSALSAPLIAIYAYLMPVFLMNRLPRLAPYRSPFGSFVFIMGLIGILGDFVGSYVL
jgi:serine transporter